MTAPMMQPLERLSRSLLRKRIEKLASAIEGLWSLAKEGRLAWLVHFVRCRFQYNLRALHSGVAMNRTRQGDLYNFRRNIHRIEKGLLHKLPKAAFAEDYIWETISYLAQIKSSGASDANTNAWGEAVLDHYFMTCNHTQTVAEAYALYRKLEPQNRQPTWYPYPVRHRPDLAVEYEDLYQLALRRRSVRQYLDRTVEFDQVEKAMRVAALSPSACNRQSFKFLFYNKKEIVREISQIPGGFVGFEVPSIIVVVGSYRGYFDERDANVPTIDASLAAMAFLFALESLGLSSVCLNWPALPDRDEALRRLIHLEDDEFVVMLIGIGYPDPAGKIPYSAKRDIHSLIQFNERLEPNGPGAVLPAEKMAVPID